MVYNLRLVHRTLEPADILAERTIAYGSHYLYYKEHVDWYSAVIVWEK